MYLYLTMQCLKSRNYLCVTLIVILSRYCLLRTLKQTQMTLDFLHEIGVEVHWHGRAKNETAQYCVNCKMR